MPDGRESGRKKNGAAKATPVIESCVYTTLLQRSHPVKHRREGIPNLQGDLQRLFLLLLRYRDRLQQGHTHIRISHIHTFSLYSSIAIFYNKDSLCGWKIQEVSWILHLRIQSQNVLQVLGVLFPEGSGSHNLDGISALDKAEHQLD